MVNGRRDLLREYYLNLQSILFLRNGWKEISGVDGQEPGSKQVVDDTFDPKKQ